MDQITKTTVPLLVPTITKTHEVTRKFFPNRMEDKKLRDALDRGEVEQVLAVLQQDDGKSVTSNSELVFKILNIRQII